jgi:uncharacterized protein YdiU (UPF0061 family)
MFQLLDIKETLLNELMGCDDPQTRRGPVPGVHYSRVNPKPVSSPSWLGFSGDLGRLLNIPQTPDVLEVLSGNKSEALIPYAMRYGGHQFGHWAGQLGDGRAINLGFVKGVDGKSYEVQLKGAGQTPFSRGADGRAVVRSSVREFICSEYMNNIGIPTTWALALVGTGDKVVRDILYSGNPQYEEGAITVRVSESFIRFGNFEIHAENDELEQLKALVSVSCDLLAISSEVSFEERVKLLYKEVLERTSHLVAGWMGVGFVHGVMNTDNMSILGQTIDYGPYGWLEEYDPEWTPNTSDSSGRYAYGRQPGIAHWNLHKLAEALVAVCPEPEFFEGQIQRFEQVFMSDYSKVMANKIGFESFDSDEIRKSFLSLEKLLGDIRPDWTLFFSTLTDLVGRNQAVSGEAEFKHCISQCLYGESALEGHMTALYKWFRSYISLCKTRDGFSAELMKSANPRFIPRNYLLYDAYQEIENEGTHKLLGQIFEVIQDPYSKDIPTHLLEKRPARADNVPGCSKLSCSS